MKSLWATAILSCSVFGAIQQEKPGPQAQGAVNDPHHQGVIERGDRVMGFSHDQTAHRFLLYSDGGAIDVESNNPGDAATRDAIRSHFTHIVKMFAAGDFNAPMLIHVQNPPGTETLKRLREQVQYKLENTGRGARIRITTKNPEALKAVHRFLRFQITDHQTGDSTER